MPELAPATSEPLCVSVREAARLLGLSQAYVYELLDAEKIAEVRSGRRRLVVLQSLREYVAA